MGYNEKLPVWDAEGIEPPDSKKQSGWAVEDKPPAGWWNWLLNRTYKAVKELREKAAEKTWVEEQIAGVKVDVPDASLTQKGVVQLSNATDRDAEDQAATPKAVKDATLQAKSYTDQQISLVTETGIPKLVSYPLKVTATTDNQKVFEIPLDLFDANTDTLLIAINRAVLDSTQYTLTNTVRDGAGQVTQRAKITLLSGVTTTSEVTMVVLKNVPIGPDGAINGAVLALDSVPINRVNGLQDQLDEVFQSVSDGKKAIASAITGKGVAASGSDSFSTLSTKITQINTGSWVEYSETDRKVNTTSGVYYPIVSIPKGKKFMFVTNAYKATGIWAVLTNYNPGDYCNVYLTIRNGNYRTDVVSAEKASSAGSVIQYIKQLQIDNTSTIPRFRCAYEDSNQWTAWQDIANSVNSEVTLSFYYVIKNAIGNITWAYGDGKFIGTGVMV